MAKQSSLDGDVVEDFKKKEAPKKSVITGKQERLF
jgi:hypothetical protein